MWAAPQKLPLLVQSALAVAIVTLLGPLVYRLAYQPLADATVLVLLIVSVGVHFALIGLGLVFFGAEGFRNPSFWDQRFSARAARADRPDGDHLRRLHRPDPRASTCSSSARCAARRCARPRSTGSARA